MPKQTFSARSFSALARRSIVRSTNAQWQSQHAAERPKRSLKATFDGDTNSLNDHRVKPDNLVGLCEEGGAVRALERTREALKAIRTEYRRQLHARLAEAYAIADYLRKNRDAWEEFRKDRRWKTLRCGSPKQEQQTNALKLVFRYILGSGRAADRRISKYHSALRAPFERGDPYCSIPSTIAAAGGLEKLARASVAPRSTRAQQPPPRTSSFRVAKTDHWFDLEQMKAGEAVRLVLQKRSDGIFVIVKSRVIPRRKQ